MKKTNEASDIHILFYVVTGLTVEVTSVPLNSPWCSKNHNTSLITIFREATVHDKYWHETAGIISSHFSAGVFYSDLNTRRLLELLLFTFIQFVLLEHPQA